MEKVVFENISLPLPLEFYSEDCANATWDDIVAWMEKATHIYFGKLGLSYSVDKASFIVSYTVYGKEKDSPKRCTTVFGKTPLSAYQKMLYLVEFARWGDRTEREVDEYIYERTLELKMLLKK